MRTSLRCEIYLTPLLALPRTMSIRLQRVELWPMEAGDHWPLHPGLQFICRLCSAVSLSAALQSAPALSVTITYQSITVSRPLTSNWSFSQPEGRRIIIRLVQRINRFIALVCIESKYYRVSSSLRCSSAVLVHQSPVRVDWLVVELAVLVLNRAHDDVPRLTRCY